MSLEIIQNAIDTVRALYADPREHIFDVTARLEGQQVFLSGKVLDSSQLGELEEGLKSSCAGLKFDVSGIQIVRKSTPLIFGVAANLTSMHAEPSFLAEMVTQLVNGMQVEVLQEEGRWVYGRKHHDSSAPLDAADHYIGWTYRPYLDPAPVPPATHLVTAPVGLLRAEPCLPSGLVTRLLGGSAVSVTGHQAEWARLVLAGGEQGWLPQAELRALADLPQAESQRRENLLKDAFTMIGVPYLWGGCSAHGIDCSGFAQLLHRWIGIALPRDADMQYAAGKPVEPPFEAGDLLFFGEKGENRRITHVAISLGGWRIIHSSRARNGIQVDDVQLVEGLRQSFLCAATYLR